VLFSEILESQYILLIICCPRRLRLCASRRSSSRAMAATTITKVLCFQHVFRLFTGVSFYFTFESHPAHRRGCQGVINTRRAAKRFPQDAREFHQPKNKNRTFKPTPRHLHRPSAVSANAFFARLQHRARSALFSFCLFVNCTELCSLQRKPFLNDTGMM
jgi:hypothetical protein